MYRSFSWWLHHRRDVTLKQRLTNNGQAQYSMARPLLILTAAAAAALLTGHTAHAFAVGPNPPTNPAQRPAPTSPYERRDRPMDPDEAAAAPAPFVLGPGSRVAVVGADSGALGRLVTKRLFTSQFRAYLMVKDVAKVPSGLGLDQYKVRTVCVGVVCILPSYSVG